MRALLYYALCLLERGYASLGPTVQCKADVRADTILCPHCECVITFCPVVCLTVRVVCVFGFRLFCFGFFFFCGLSRPGYNLHRLVSGFLWYLIIYNTHCIIWYVIIIQLIYPFVASPPLSFRRSNFRTWLLHSVVNCFWQGYLMSYSQNIRKPLNVLF